MHLKLAFFTYILLLFTCLWNLTLQNNTNQSNLPPIPVNVTLNISKNELSNLMLKLNNSSPTENIPLNVMLQVKSTQTESNQKKEDHRQFIDVQVNRPSYSSSSSAEYTSASYSYVTFSDGRPKQKITPEHDSASKTSVRLYLSTRSNSTSPSNPPPPLISKTNIPFTPPVEEHSFPLANNPWKWTNETKACPILLNDRDLFDADVLLGHSLDIKSNTIQEASLAGLGLSNPNNIYENNVDSFWKFQKLYMNLPECTLNQYDFANKQKIGRGGQAVAYLVKERATGNNCIYKEYKKINEYYREVNIQASVNHENVIKLKCVNQDKQGIMMPYYESGDLWQGGLPYNASEETLATYAAQLVLAVEAIHSAGFLHHDIKPQNLVRGSGKDGDHIWMIDMGLTVKLKDANYGRGTKITMAPEVARIVGYESAPLHQGLDWWSVGATLYMLHTLARVPPDQRRPSSQFVPYRINSPNDSPNIRGKRGETSVLESVKPPTITDSDDESNPVAEKPLEKDGIPTSSPEEKEKEAAVAKKGTIPAIAAAISDIIQGAIGSVTGRMPPQAPSAKPMEQNKVTEINPPPLKQIYNSTHQKENVSFVDPNYLLLLANENFSQRSMSNSSYVSSPPHIHGYLPRNLVAGNIKRRRPNNRSNDRSSFKNTITFSGIPSYFSNELKSLLRILMNPNPNRRRFINHRLAILKKHPYFKGINWDTVGRNISFNKPNTANSNQIPNVTDNNLQRYKRETPLALDTRSSSSKTAPNFPLSIAIPPIGPSDKPAMAA